MDERATHVPLAERMRPRAFERLRGQDHLLGKGKILGQLIESGTLVSLIFWGPPGSGKTTLAMMLARHFDLPHTFFSAVLSGIKEVKEVMARAESHRRLYGKPMIIFIDEIHRFNKAQQGAFLPYVERGDIILFGSTTENPSFEIIAPLLSRTKVLLLNALTREAMSLILDDALADEAHGLGGRNLRIEEDARGVLIEQSNGDARRALNTLDLAASLTSEPSIGLETIREALQKRTAVYDKAGEEHFNLISALHKSLRDSDPDGALYWLYRMLEAGEEPLYICRRLIRFASEDVGVADPQALSQTISCQQAFQTLGSPEGTLALAQAVVYLATAPKSNALYTAESDLRQQITRTGSLPVPMHLRNAPTSLMKKLGYGKGYQYAHDKDQGLVEQNHLPPELAGTIFYSPTTRGYEAVIKDRLSKWRQILQQRKQEHNASKK